ncbi:hypothetical protein OHB01_25505 [Microbispora hainanensis]|uniref:hypothetical protein n=1 Tax=Microbispora TaxID=2005 RepID=UPI00115B33C9|nr:MULTISPECIES: hypothetical protein [Microbispora]NJP29294.1 hypothetical protein [Microbispora sp. CL1-1]TQS05681.1 hypothetical protein FLW53_34865 [Microbispora sp. SCL1-1]
MTMRTNRHDERDDITERPTPETPEPLEEEARREQAVADAGRDEHEGPGPVYSPGAAYAPDHTDGTAQTKGTADTDGTAETDGTAHSNGTVHTDGAADTDGAAYADGTAHADGTVPDAGDRAYSDAPETRDDADDEPYGQAGDDVLTSPKTGGGHTAEDDPLVAGDHAGSLAEASGDVATGAYGTHDAATDLDPGTDGNAITGTTTGAMVDGPVAYPTTTAAAPGDDEAFDSRWREIKTGFVDDPRHSVEQADALVEEALSALTSRRQELLDQWKDDERGDTEALRLALHEYHTLLAHLNRK